MQTSMKTEWFFRKWDENDEWAVRTFGFKSPMRVTKRVLIRNAMEKTAGQEKFDALFRVPVMA